VQLYTLRSACLNNVSLARATNVTDVGSVSPWVCGPSPCEMRPRRVQTAQPHVRVVSVMRDFDYRGVSCMRGSRPCALLSDMRPQSGRRTWNTLAKTMQTQISSGSAEHRDTIDAMWARRGDARRRAEATSASPPAHTNHKNQAKGQGGRDVPRGRLVRSPGQSTP
jgi:hypothetical protein